MKTPTMFNQQSGYTLVPQGLSQATCNNIIAVLNSDHYRIRDVLAKQPEIVEMLQAANVLGPYQPHHIRRSVLFTKPPTANWKVPWHQDILVQIADDDAVTHNEAVFTKESILHVQPPVHIMEATTAVRIHLTACHEQDGPLRVRPGSHREGYVPFNGITDLDGADSVTVTCDQGGILYFNPLLLHSSLPTTSGNPRMVLHFELCDLPLLPPFQWRHGNNA